MVMLYSKVTTLGVLLDNAVPEAALTMMQFSRNLSISTKNRSVNQRGFFITKERCHMLHMMHHACHLNCKIT